MSLPMPNPNNLRDNAPALVVFVVCVLTRAILQGVGGPAIGDVSWITTFGAIAASWLGISAQLGRVKSTTDQVQRQTNGVLSAKIEEHAQAAADAAVAKVIASQNSTDVPSLHGEPSDEFTRDDYGVTDARR